MSVSSQRSFLADHWKSLIAFFILIATIQGLNTYATFPAVTTWYETLQRPSWTPPNWVFGPVWTILYIMLALCGWLLWNRTSGSGLEKFKSPAVTFYFVQLACNALWSALFFGMQNPLYGLICIAFLAFFSFATLYYSNKYNHKAAAYMLIPYCLWISYATQLNAAIVMLN